jgi:hypothetical protein
VGGEIDIHGGYRTALTAAETGTAALREVWPAGIPSLAPTQDVALRAALRNIEDGWAELLRVRSDFED